MKIDTIMKSKAKLCASVIICAFVLLFSALTIPVEAASIDEMAENMVYGTTYTGNYDHFWNSDMTYKYYKISCNTSTFFYLEGTLTNSNSNSRCYFEIIDANGNTLCGTDDCTFSFNGATNVKTAKLGHLLDGGTYYVCAAFGYTGNRSTCNYSVYCNKEDAISLGTVSINSISTPEWGTAIVTFSPLNNALGYETRICNDLSFNDPITITSIEPTATASGLTNRINYTRTRAYAAYSDGTQVFSGWSQPRSFAFPKLRNPLKIKAKIATIKQSKLKKKAQTLSISKAITFINKGKGALVYTKASGNKKISINKKTGKITIKKGLKKGIYKVKVKVKAAGNSDYNPSSVNTVTFKIKVK